MGKLTWSVLKKRTVYSEATGVSLELGQLIGNTGFKVPHGRKVVSDLDLYKVHALVKGLRFTLVDDFPDVIEFPKSIEIQKSIEFPKSIKVAKSIKIAKSIKVAKSTKFLEDIDTEVLLLEKIYKEVLSRVTATGFKQKGSVLVFKVVVQGGYNFESLDGILRNSFQSVVGLSLVDKDKKEIACWYFDDSSGDVSLTRRYLRSYDFADDFVANEVAYMKRA